MRTFTIVPSFEGNSALFELPDIGFQGDHLSFAILFNLTELTEHWPNIQPTMIVTDPQSNTFVAPNTFWNSETHIFTWNISSVETAYEGNLQCQLKCTAADDPTTIVCMSQICQTHVYKSLAAADNPPEAFQSWLDTLTLLSAQISEDANVVLSGVEASETNARTAQEAADSAAATKAEAEQIQESIEATATDVQTARTDALSAKQQAQDAALRAGTARDAAIEAAEDAAENLEASDRNLANTRAAKDTALDAASQASTYMSNARNAQTAAEQARDAAISAKTGLEQARDAAISAKNDAEAAQAIAETAAAGASSSEHSALDAQALAEDAAELSKKWAVGKDRNDTPVAVTDDTHNNYAQYWAGRSQQEAQNATAAKDIILGTRMSTARYSPSDESITFMIGTTMSVNG